MRFFSKISEMIKKKTSDPYVKDAESVAKEGKTPYRGISDHIATSTYGEYRSHPH